MRVSRDANRVPDEDALAETLALAGTILKWSLIVLVATFAVFQLAILLGLIWTMATARTKDDVRSPPP